MNIREDIYNIPDLIFSEETKNMPLDQWNVFITKLDIFITSFPVKEAKLKAAIEKNDYKKVFQHLQDIVGLLKTVYALEIAYECQNQIQDLDINNPEKIEAYVSFLLSNISALSIDIQMALYGIAARNATEQQNSTSNELGGKGRKWGDLDVGRFGEIKMDTSEKKDSSEEEFPLKNIIAVDDEPVSLFILKSSLRHLPCNVIAVNSAKEALEMLEKVKADLFVLDIDMPEMNGIELAKKLKLDGQKAPIVFLTGNAKKEYVHECLDLGASDFIIKPIYPVNVAKRLQRFL